jgi:signal transduction histidine kinase/DNA-binding response OmpR family regulator
LDGSPNLDTQREVRAADGELLEPEVRARILSVTRIQLATVLVTVGLLAAFAATVFAAVDAIFKSLTPVHESGLHWKATRGIGELARTTDLAILVGDQALLAEAMKDYVADEEVSAVVVEGADETVLLKREKREYPRKALFAGSPRTVRTVGGTLLNWSYVEVEGGRVGRVGLAVSTHQLRAGLELRTNILRAAALGLLLACVASLAFVRLYIAPIIRVTRDAFLRLEQRTREALEATRVKGEFLANVSHELRTPLNAILGMAGMLSRTSLDAQQRRYVNISQGSAESLLTLINDVLDFSKLEAGKYELHPGSTDIRLLVQDRLELLAVRAQAKQLEIAYQVAEDVPMRVEIDGDRLRQVLTNLVGNAVKFTDDGEVFVNVHCEKTSDEKRVVLHFSVRDTGPGIREEDRHRLFRSFSQVDGSLTRNHEGTGLGLVISAELVRLMGGEIHVDSTPGEGSTFSFTIDAVVLEGVKPIEQMRGTPRGLKVLIADASATTRHLIRDDTARWGMDPHEADSFESTLQILRDATASNRPFDIVVIDLKLEPSAQDPLTALLKQVGGPALSVIYLVAGYVPPERYGEGARVVTKPVRASELYDTIVARDAPMGDPLERSGTLNAPLHAHVLVVDDNEVNRVVAAETLHGLGYSCDVVATGYEAIDRVKARAYDAILMDCQMPGMNGYQTTSELRRLESGTERRSLIIALTAHAFHGEAERARAADMDDFLTKPVSPRVLDTTLRRWIDARRAGVASKVPEQMTSASVQPEPSSDAPEDHPVLRDQPRSLRLLEVFLKLAPGQMQELVQASATEDAANVRTHAHKLKGSAASVGAIRLAKLAHAIHRAIDEGASSPNKQWILQAQDLLSEVEGLLKRELEQKKAASAAS